MVLLIDAFLLRFQEDPLSSFSFTFIQKYAASFFMLAASTGKHNVTVSHPSIHPISMLTILTGGSMQRGQRTFRPGILVTFTVLVSSCIIFIELFVVQLLFVCVM